MIRLALSLLALTTPATMPAMAQDMPVPSGMQTRFVEVVLEPDAAIARFRFLAPDLGTPGHELVDVAGDFVWLCERMAIPALDSAGWEAEQIVISISDQAVGFGETNPDVLQYFDGFSIAGDSCLWEPF
ncbi:DUF6497 family protein [Flavimaricola marinus]|uniref:Acetolactate synthase n=1 Tax=Flavimaricola marinus TaxID=1819565 RepID=A0A238LG28_9RHOB|nr:DUF6497 family protein [Flavimaricola marinus]SMY08532.1 hypothetical protein LOM8899_02685 [Flavimaricola marinus]